MGRGCRSAAGSRRASTPRRRLPDPGPTTPSARGAAARRRPPRCPAHGVEHYTPRVGSLCRGARTPPRAPVRTINTTCDTPRGHLVQLTADHPRAARRPARPARRGLVAHRRWMGYLISQIYNRYSAPSNDTRAACRYARLGDHLRHAEPSVARRPRRAPVLERARTTRPPVRRREEPRQGTQTGVQAGRTATARPRAVNVVNARVFYDGNSNSSPRTTNRAFSLTTSPSCR